MPSDRFSKSEVERLLRSERPWEHAFHDADVLFFEAPSMRELYAHMDEWKDKELEQNSLRRIKSISVQPEGNGFACIAVTDGIQPHWTNTPLHRELTEIQELLLHIRGHLHMMRSTASSGAV